MVALNRNNSNAIAQNGVGFIYRSKTPRAWIEKPSEASVKVKVYSNVIEIISPLRTAYDPDTNERNEKHEFLKKHIDVFQAAASARNRRELEEIDAEKYQQNKIVKGNRKKITAFKRSSRTNLLKKVGKASFMNDGGYFVTLTYPRQFSMDFNVWKRDLDTFLKRLRRYAAMHQLDDLEIEFRYLWKLEFQQRMAPHYHLLVFGLPADLKQEFKEWCSRVWFEITGSSERMRPFLAGTKYQYMSDQQLLTLFNFVGRDKFKKEFPPGAYEWFSHLKAGTNCRYMNNAKMVMSYCAKYVSKETTMYESKTGEIIPFTGRFWGTSNNWDAGCEVYYVTPQNLAQLRLFISSHLADQGAVRYATRVLSLRNFFVLGIGSDTYWDDILDDWLYRAS